MKKLLVLMAGAAGYVLGTRAGRERYEQIKRTATRVRNDPRVQEKAQQAADAARQQAPVVKDKVSSATSSATDAARAKVSSSPDASVEELHPDSTARQGNPGPQGELP